MVASIKSAGKLSESSIRSQDDLEKVVEQEQPKKKWRWRVDTSDAPKEIFNRTLYLSILVFGVLGSARGYDEGNISGTLAQVSFKKTFGLSDPHKSKDEVANLKSNIAAMVQLGSIGGSLLAMYTVDRLGRIRALQQVCIIWIIAAIIQITSKNVGQLYAGRLIEGFAIGQTTTIGPLYTAEVAPPQIRGMCGCIFAGAVYFGIMMGYFANYGTALHMLNTSQVQWIAPTSIKIVLAGLIFIGSFLLCVESPRWLVKVGKVELAAQNLSKTRHLPPDHPYIVGEVADINELIAIEQEAISGSGVFDKIREILTVKSVRYRFFAVATMSQLLGQWSGANAVTIYSPELMGFAGYKGVERLKMTAVLGVVKFISAYASAFFIIDFLGRRKALYTGITLQMISILFFAIFVTVVPNATEDVPLPLTASEDRAAKAALASLYLSGVGWTMGFNSIQYLLGSEIFPLRIRSFAQSAIMVLHFANQYGNSKALPKMLLSMHKFGAFYFFVGIMAISLFWAWFFVPEVAGRSLESMEDIFSLPWYMIGRKGAELCPDHSEVSKIHVNSSGHGNAYDGKLDYDEKTSVHHDEGNSLMVKDSNEKDLEKEVKK